MQSLFQSQTSTFSCTLTFIGTKIVYFPHFDRKVYLNIRNEPILFVSQKTELILQALPGLGGSVGCAVRLETRRSRVQPPPRSATFFRGD